jgi:hypothetical protein
MADQTNQAQDAVDQRRKNSGELKYTNTAQSAGYSIGAYEFPDGLRTNPDLQHYVAFYINVRDKSSSGKTNKNQDFFVSGAEQAKIDAINRSSLSQKNIQEGLETLQSKETSMAVGAFIGVGVSIGMGTKLKDWKKTLAAGGAGALTGLAINKLIKMADLPNFSSGKTSRLRSVITLHVSERPTVKYGTNYTNKDLGILTGLLVQGSAQGALSTITNPEIQAALISSLAKVPSMKQAGGMISDMLELGNRQKTNPFREVMFESVDYRTFQFSYKFFPKSAAETNKVKKIIDLFKTNMHPELTEDKFFYIYPSEFDIEYFYKDQPNEYIHKFARCALTNMSVEYGGDQFATFEDGAPVEIGMTLTFQELEQMTSEGIKKYGY